MRKSIYVGERHCTWIRQWLLWYQIKRKAEKERWTDDIVDWTGLDINTAARLTEDNVLLSQSGGQHYDDDDHHHQKQQ